MPKSTQDQARDDARKGKKPDPNRSGKDKKRYDAAYNKEKKKNS